jgi:hypothetical protein
VAGSGGEQFSEEQPAYQTDAPGPGMSDVGDLTDAKIAAAEARTDTKIARVEGKLDLVVAKIDEGFNALEEQFDALREDNRATRANQWVIGFGLAVLIIAVAALFPEFLLGSKVRDMVDHAVQAHAVKNP